MKFSALVQILAVAHLWTTAEASFFSRSSPSRAANESHSLLPRDTSCGPHYMPCPSNQPCCNHGTCHRTSMESCPISLGCDAKHSFLDSCFPLPGCSNIKDSFKQSSLLIPKHQFTGDPLQAHWISDYHHVAPYAKIDAKQHKMLLRVRRDMVMTKAGGGYGASISSTRWNRFGTFSAKFKAGSHGPGIVTAMMLNNPANGDQISFEITGKEPTKVHTNYFHRAPIAGSTLEGSEGTVDSTPTVGGQLVAHEEVYDLPKSAVDNMLTYKIEWTDKHIKFYINKKLIRTVLAKDAPEGLPTNAMELQLSTWDAGYSKDTVGWAGGPTDYGQDQLTEYVTEVDSIEIACQNPKDGKAAWPGPDAKKRLEQTKIQMAAEAKRQKQRDHEAGTFKDGHQRTAKGFFRIDILTLVKWACLGAAMYCGKLYLQEAAEKLELQSSSTLRRTSVVHPIRATHTGVM